MRQRHPHGRLESAHCRSASPRAAPPTVQEAVIKEQIKAAIGIPSVPADGAGPSSALAAAPAQPEAGAGQAGGSGGGGGECVQDLGVITGKRVRPSLPERC